MDSDINFSQSYLNDNIYYEIEDVDSTNNFLEVLAKKHDIKQKTIVRADFQSQGKGNQNTTWESEKGKNLLFSMLVFPKELSISRQFFISKSVSLGIFDMISKLVHRKDVKIKWPNDVLIGSKKISGTLIKGSVKNGLLSQNIIGIGLNVNQEQFTSGLDATSLKSITGQDFNIEYILRELLSCLDARLADLNENKFAKINMDYHQNLLSYRTWRSYYKNGIEFKGRILEVCDDGRVIIETDGGDFKKFELKEISLNRDF